jgi:hypothetical protein
MSGTNFHYRRADWVGFRLEMHVTEDDIRSADAKAALSGGHSEQFRDGIKRAVDKGWMVRHESGTYCSSQVDRKY